MSKQTCINYRKEKKTLHLVSSLHARSSWRPETAYCSKIETVWQFVISSFWYKRLKQFLNLKYPYASHNLRKQTLFDVCVNMTIILNKYCIESFLW